MSSIISLLFTYVNSAGIDSYEGQFSNHKMEGHGTMRFSNKDKFVGELKDDAFCGHGTLSSSDGKILFCGQWKNSKPLEFVEK